MLQADNDSVITAHNFVQFCEHHGILQRFSPPHTPSMNGVAERMWRTINDAARSMLLWSG